jgi:amino acid adenylation domain-containing protein
MNAPMNAAALEPVEFDPFAGDAVERVIPTSEAQREVWLADKLSPHASLAFNESVRLHLVGHLDVSALQGALNALVTRHDALRSTVGPDGTELLVSTSGGVPLVVIDLRALGTVDAGSSIERAAIDAVETPFNLEQGPLFRAALFCVADDKHVLLMTAHHIVCDGWSWGLITEDLGALYAEMTGAAPGPDPAPSYGDYVAWEAAEVATPAMAEHERFWLGCFAGSSLPVLDLPTDRPRAPARTFNSKRVDYLLDAALVADVRRLGAKAGASVFATLFSGFAATLHRLTGQDDLVIGVPVAGQSASGMTGLVGHCVNLLPIRTAVDAAQPFDAYVQRSGTTLLDAFDHQTLTFGSLLKKLPLRRDPSRLPLVSVMFNVDQAVKGNSSAFPGLSAELAANPRQFENFELFVNAAQVSDGLSLECQYNTDLFDAATIARWMTSYEALLRAAVAEPGQAIGRLAWLAPNEITALLALQPTRTPVQADLMHSAFARQAAATPERVALRHGDTQLSYEAVDKRSNRLARALRALGIQRGERVGLCLSRGADMVVALIAVLKAGGAYIPLDPSFPAARLAYYAEDADLALLLTESTLTTAPLAWRSDAAQRVLRLDLDTAWLNESPDALPVSTQDAGASDTAYIIYTSGSTGKPKGVCLPHRAVANFLASMRDEPGIQPDDRLAAVTTLSFDIAVLELMLPLTVGAQVVIVPRDTAMDGNLLFALLQSSGATIMQATPGMWRMLLDTQWNGSAGFKALVGGESLPPDLARDLLDRTSELWNMYGPTETTVWSTVWPVNRDAVRERGVSIGRPIGNTSVWILNESLQPCPKGVPGEICIGGDGVAAGYLDRPELTADRFVADPFSGAPGARLYRTGDRGRWRNDDLLEHLGRLDFQVKVRGYRIELGEIEAGCNEIDGVTQSVVLAREDHPGDVRLVAYLTVSGATAFDESALRSHLRGRLPEYMLPQHVMVLDAIPMLPNGKVDRKALPAPDASHLQSSAERVGPRGELERAVLAAMEAVLNLPGLGVHDDFFALGGHSLLAARLTARLNRDFDLNLPLRTLFESPSAEALALAVGKARGANAPKRRPIVPEPGRGTAPLTPAQDRIRFLEELQPDRVLYNTPSAHRLSGAMDVAKFEQALQELVRRQSSLRTFIAADPQGGGHVQIIAPELHVSLPFEDLTSVPEGQREAELMRRMQAVVDTPIDIHVAPLFRVALYKLAQDQHAFLFMPHHIIWDGWSFDLLYEDMSAIYGALVEGRANPLPALPVSFGDYAQWHAEWMQGPEFEHQLRYWKDRFNNAPMPKAPTPDQPRRAGMTGEGASEWVRIDRGLADRLREVARIADATLNMLTMAVYTAMMAQVVESESIVIGVPVRGRSVAEVEPIMGFFNNMLPVQLPVRPEVSALDFIRAIKRDLLEVFSHQDIPFERLAAEPEVAARSRVGLYQALFSFQDARDRKRQWGGLSHQGILIFQKGATEDLGLWLMEVPGGLEGGFTYNADIYTAQTASAFRERYVELLNRLADDPQLTLARLLEPLGSESARYLRRLAPPATDPDAPAVRTGADAPSAGAGLVSPTQRAIAEVWAALLGIDAAQLAVQDNFFELGGSSLLAMQAVNQLEQRLGRSVSARRYVFETLGQLAAGYEAAESIVQAAPKREGAPRGGVMKRLVKLVTGA